MSSPDHKSEFDVPMSHEFPVRENVRVVPWGTNPTKGAQRSAGLFDASGAYLRDAICNRWGDDELTIEPQFDQNVTPSRLAGTWLFGGMLYGHFGHFLCESTGRLWALDHVKEPIDGILWLPKVPLGHAARMVRPYVPFFNSLGEPQLKLAAPQDQVIVERIIIPEQAFGIGKAIVGKPEYRRFMRGRLAKPTEKTPNQKLYVSRTGLPTKRGSVLLEDRLESLMANDGYQIFRPEEHPIDVQINSYRNAAYIVGLDGSALHLAAMVVQPKTRVAIINRGPSQNIEDYANQFKTFVGIDVLQIHAIRAYWFEAGRRVVKRETHALLDFGAVHQVLFQNGFIRTLTWQQPDQHALAEAIKEKETRSGQILQRYDAKGVQ